MDNFKKAFNEYYNDTTTPFVIVVHHAALYSDPKAMYNFTLSIEYMKQKNVIFMTEDEAFRGGI